MPEETKNILANQRITAQETIASLANERKVVIARKNAMQEILKNLEVLVSEDWAELTERALMIGKPALALVKCRDRIQAYVEQLQIKPIEQAQIKPVDRGLIHGVIANEFTHVHLDNKLYIFDKAQAKALDQVLLKEFNVSLTQAGVVPF